MSCRRMTIAFRGANYCGWQVQSNAKSVCEAFQDAVESVLGARYSVKGCSRTDAGVNANGFVLALYADTDIPPHGLLMALNHALPEDIAVLDCEAVPESFHPRYDCTAKRYIYKILDREAPSPFLAGLALHHPHTLDIPLMDSASRCFIGRHDFSAFCASGSSIPVGARERTITECGVRREGETVIFSVTGDGFLYNMVRIMTGTLLEVAQGRIAPDELPAVIDSRDRARAGATAPAHGLYLDRVFYE